MTNNDRVHMSEAIKSMREAEVVDRTCGPFGCIIVREGQVLIASAISVIKDNEPTAQAEVNAIRIA